VGYHRETCTHYLTLTAEECDERHNVNPPVRSKEDQETLWKRVADGTISCIGTDHCANLRDDKVGEDVPDSLPGFPDGDDAPADPLGGGSTRDASRSNARSR